MSTVKAPVYLLCMQALHQCYHRYLSQLFFIAGTANRMPNDASCRFDLSDAALLTHFDYLFPQTTSLPLVQPRSKYISFAAQTAAHAGVVSSCANANPNDHTRVI